MQGILAGSPATFQHQLSDIAQSCSLPPTYSELGKGTPPHKSVLISDPSCKLWVAPSHHPLACLLQTSDPGHPTFQSAPLLQHLTELTGSSVFRVATSEIKGATEQLKAKS